MRPPRVVLAPDKFKGSLSAPQVVDALARGIAAIDPTVEVDRAPVADGGEGTVDAALAAGFAERVVTVEGPVGNLVRARYAVRADTALVEMAECCGLQRYDAREPDALLASSHGLGQAVADAVAAGCTTVVVGIGGSASTDGGAGLLTGLGARLLDAAGDPVGRGLAGLADLTSVDLGPVTALLDGVRLVAACDVANPLVGPDGAAPVFGPQKGLDAAGIALAEARLPVLAGLVAPDLAERPGAGAAGGAGFALLALGAEFVPGIDVVVGLVDLEARIARADLVVVGEGGLDRQSLLGKGPVGLARVVQRHGRPVVAVAGVSEVDAADLAAVGIGEVHELRALEPDHATSMREADRLLEQVGRTIAAGLRTRS